MAAALQAAKSLKAGQRCVVLLADSIRNYMSKHLNDDFMWRQGFVDAAHNIGVGERNTSGLWWATRTVGDLKFQVGTWPPSPSSAGLHLT
jgi:cystathionine beta-synthase